MLRHEPLRICDFPITLPGLPIMAAQLAVSTIDWLLAGSVLYVLLPSAPELLFPMVAGAYLLSQIIGLISRVPGGFGVLERAMVQLAEHLRVIDHLYPNLRIDFVAVKGRFGPELVEALARRFGVPKNYMFIGTPGDKFPHRIEDLGGVRVVL